MHQIRSMKQSELQQLVAWAEREGWEPGQHDARCYWDLDPEGFLALEAEDGHFIGGGAIIRHSPSFGFMGLFIVDEGHRGNGLGRDLWYARRDTLLSRLTADATIGLDGVYDMVPFYEKGGFEQYSYHRRFRLSKAKQDAARHHAMVDLRQVDLQNVADYDAKCFPANRARFLSDWIEQTSAISLGYMDRNQLKGFAVMRPCTTGWRIGPLFADSLEVADYLFQALQVESASCLEQGEMPIFIDVPDYNPHGKLLCQKYDMVEVFGCVRMYYGSPPKLDEACIYGVTTLEVG
ncbi:MAG: GNAT family N-acetyltransferase [Rubripirellula sp.]